MLPATQNKIQSERKEADVCVFNAAASTKMRMLC